MGNIGSGAAGQVVSNSSGIASGAVSNAGLGGLSNSLKTGIAGSLASGVGGLVSSLPGGQFLAPIVQEYVSQFTSTLFGISGGTPIGLATEGVVLANAPTITPTGGPGAGGIAQTGLANTIATEQGFMTSNQNTGQTAANTDAIKQTEQRIQNLTQQGCNEEKKARGEMESLTNLFYKLIPAALKARINATAEIYNKISEYFNKAYQVSPGARGIANTGTPGANNDGESVIAQPNQDIKDSNKEVLNKHVAQGQQNPNPNVKKAAQDAAQAAASVPEFVKQPLLTDQKRTALKDPEQRGNMSPEEYWDSIDRAAEDTRANAYLWLTGNVDNEQRLKNEVGLAQLVAGGGFRDIRECTEFINQQNADPNFVGPPTSAAQFCNPDKWKVKTPGSAVQSTWLKSLLAFWDFLTSSDVHQSDAIKAVADQPVIAIQDLSQPPQGAGSGQGPITPGQDPCPTTDPCPKSGWQPNQINTAGIENAISNSLNNQLDNLLNGGFGGDGDSSGGGSGFNPGDLAAIIGNVAASLPPPPPIQISFTQTKVDNIHSKLGWNAPAATFCKSGNNWVGSEPGIAAETPLGPNGNVTVTHQANATYEISCYNSANADQKQLRLQ
ncbi:MAG: hypothetical protein HYT48_00420 [Candidatus Vogelbacteria bacterium]|nr:hypothetical protein [Candidatus Vogelbacteria bacterium]